MTEENLTLKEKKSRVPHVYVLLLAIIVVCALLTYIIPAGTYDYMTIDTSDGLTREVVDPDSYTQVEQTPVDLMGILSSVPTGMVEACSIIFFIFIVGGAFGVLQDTGAIAAGIGKLTNKLSGRETLLIPVLMFFFALAGSVIGMAEETIPFIPIMVALCIALGFDSITGVAIVFMGAGAGFAGAFLNPFTIGVAQGIAGLPMFSGMTFRIIVFVIMVGTGIIFVMRHAKKVKKDPTLSPMYELDQQRTDKMDLDVLPNFGTREKVILSIFVLTFALLIFGVMQYGWYLTELSALFLGMAIVVGLVGKMGFNGFAISLANGMTSVAAGALIVGFARGILVVLTEGQIIDTILYGASEVLLSLPSAVAAIGIYVFQCLLNFIIPSGSGQAAVSIPIIAPLVDLLGITRQTAVLAYQLGDGISNIFSPTSGYFMAGLAIAKVPWTKWAKWILPAILLWYVIGAVLVVIANAINFGPF